MLKAKPKIEIATIVLGKKEFEIMALKHSRKRGGYCFSCPECKKLLVIEKAKQ